jgi:hypothetical protein
VESIGGTKPLLAPVLHFAAPSLQRRRPDLRFRTYAAGVRLKKIVFELNRERLPFPAKDTCASRLGALQRPGDPPQRAVPGRLDLEPQPVPEGP